jgi:ornithine--oxo-acid transaminase
MMDTPSELEARYGARNYAPLDVELCRAEGAYVWGTDGKRYLDMASAYSAVAQGHRHPRIVAAAKAQLDRAGVLSRAFRDDGLGPFLAELCALSGMDRALPMNTGAEAVETAIKAARRFAYDARGVPDGKAEIVVAEGNFHGRTTTIVGFSSEPEYRRGFGPFAPGFVTVPYGDAAALARAVSSNTAAILLEPIQGEAGIRVPPPGYLRAARELCSRTGTLLILDEIQSGFGRSGRMFCFEHEGIRPDGLCVGKALGGGLVPVSAFLARADVMAVFGPGSHGSTFGGYPLATAVAREAMRVVVEEDLPRRSADLGGHMRRRLSGLNDPGIREVRGLGLWIGVELDPAVYDAHAVCLAMAARGVLAKDTHGTVVRFAPPLIVEREQVDEAVDVFVAALRDIAGARAA